MITVLQILFVLTLIVTIILLVFKPRRIQNMAMPEHYKDLLQDYVPFMPILMRKDKSPLKIACRNF
jgi:hypothetical protein